MYTTSRKNQQRHPLRIRICVIKIRMWVYQNHPENRSGAGRLQNQNPSWAETRSGHPVGSWKRKRQDELNCMLQMFQKIQNYKYLNLQCASYTFKHDQNDLAFWYFLLL